MTNTSSERERRSGAELARAIERVPIGSSAIRPVRVALGKAATSMDEPGNKSSPPRIEVEQVGALWVMTLLGEHDVSTRRSVRDQLDRISPGTPVVVDLARARFIDSTIISVLAVAHQNDRKIALVAPTHYHGTRLVEVIGIGTIIPTFPTRAAAIAALDQPRA